MCLFTGDVILFVKTEKKMTLMTPRKKTTTK